jgi:molybdenum cofactor cytidylyltransferase
MRYRTRVNTGCRLDPGFVFLYVPQMGDDLPAALAFGTVILAAGKSLRMQRPKLLLPWGQTTVLGRLISTWQLLAARQVAVVLDGSQLHVLQELDRLNFDLSNRIPNPRPESGMWSSIRCAATWQGWAPGLSHVVIALGDQPQIQLETLRELLKFGAANPAKICQPSFAGRLRHPILLPTSAFARIQSDPARDMKDFLAARAAECAGFDVADPGLALDLDTPEDYEALQARYFSDE